MHPYLSFKGDCEAAFQFYARCLGSKLGQVFRYAGSPMEGEVPAGFREKIMHGSITIGEQILMGADVLPERYEAPSGFSLSPQIKRTTDAERIFRELATGGTVVMPLARTFGAERFGMHRRAPASRLVALQPKVSSAGYIVLCNLFLHNGRAHQLRAPRHDNAVR